MRGLDGRRAERAAGVSTDKLGLATPWLIAAALIVFAGVSLAVWNGRRGKEAPRPR